ncbi:hypothetical protein DENSPDRAFT_887483 [Dentipellis sp. KUC8613]|nr:hypothetical protein DENSPDRAFT_887483 [Dentipellis sp. KUC8613]
MSSASANLEGFESDSEEVQDILNGEVSTVAPANLADLQAAYRRSQTDLQRITTHAKQLTIKLHGAVRALEELRQGSRGRGRTRKGAPTDFPLLHAASRFCVMYELWLCSEDQLNAAFGVDVDHTDPKQYQLQNRDVDRPAAIVSQVYANLSPQHRAMFLDEDVLESIYDGTVQ